MTSKVGDLISFFNNKIENQPEAKKINKMLFIMGRIL